MKWMADATATQAAGAGWAERRPGTPSFLFPGRGLAERGVVHCEERRGAPPQDRVTDKDIPHTHSLPTQPPHIATYIQLGHWRWS